LNIYVGNLDRDVTEEMLRSLFARFGEVGKVAIMHDRHGISKGFAFIEMSSENEARSAIEGLNRTLFLDRTLDITESQPPGGKRGGSKIKSGPKRTRR
jgi:RNA recognition motif-containing protein